MELVVLYAIPIFCLLNILVMLYVSLPEYVKGAHFYGLFLLVDVIVGCLNLWMICLVTFWGKALLSAIVFIMFNSCLASV